MRISAYGSAVEDNPVKIVLLQPPVQDFYETDIRLQPLGLCYLKAAVEKHIPEVEVVVKDYHAGWGRRTVALPKELAYLREYYPFPDSSPFSTFFNYFHFGASFEALADDVASIKPDLVGISSLFSAYHSEALRCAEEIKRRLDAPIIMGGAHVSAAPKSALAHPCVDFVIRGEGERPFVEFLRRFVSGGGYAATPNLGFKQNGGMVFNDLEENYPINEIPIPDFSDLPVERYSFEKQPMAFVLASRGCPRQCSFCSVQLTFGSRHRLREPADVVEEMKLRYLEGVRVFDFEDDNLTFNKGATAELCRQISAAFPAKDIELTAMNGVAYQNIDAELLGQMREAGFRRLNISLASANAGVLKSARRPLDLDHYRNVVKKAAEMGYKIVSYQIIGLAGESAESMAETMAFMAGLPVLLGASPFYLPPGSRIAESFPAQTAADFMKVRLSAMGVESAAISRDVVYTLFITSRIINFLKGIIATGQGSLTLNEALDKAREIGGRAATGAELLDRLFRERRLYALARSGPEPLKRFQWDVFSEAWSRIKTVESFNGGSIRL